MKIFSCQINSDTGNGYGAINITFSTGSGTVTTTTCDTYQCAEALDKASVQGWLGTNYQGRNIATCYYQTANPKIAYVDANGICSYRGNAQTQGDGSISCDCTDNWTGDACTQIAAPPPGSEDRSSSATSVAVSCLFATVALGALLI